MSHEWKDGPDGKLYHCSICEISKCDDHDGYDCVGWLRRQRDEARAEATRLQSKKGQLAAINELIAKGELAVWVPKARTMLSDGDIEGAVMNGPGIQISLRGSNDDFWVRHGLGKGEKAN